MLLEILLTFSIVSFEICVSSLINTANKFAARLDLVFAALLHYRAFGKRTTLADSASIKCSQHSLSMIDVENKP
jgi:hypothetical protein